MSYKKAKVLLLDIETAPILGYVWGIWEQNVALNQINKDWHVLAWCAKWLDAPGLMYKDQRRAKAIEEDKGLLEGIWKLLDEADVVITQNGKSFDMKKLYARFILNGMKPPSPVKHIDTFEIAKRKFGFTSNKLAYMSEKLCKKYKKLEHRDFPGFELWRECLAGNTKAWKVMEKYNKHDVLSLEELYHKLAPWDNTINFNLFSDDENETCRCGSSDLEHRGFAFTATGKFQRFCCNDCGAWTRSGKNLFSKEKRASLKRGA